jgi:hypothetical protein
LLCVLLFVAIFLSPLVRWRDLSRHQIVISLAYYYVGLDQYTNVVTIPNH